MRNQRVGSTMTALLLAGGLHAAIAAAQSVPAATPRPVAISPDDPALQWGACPPVFAPGCELTVLRGDPALPNADAILRVPGGYRIAPHSHTSAERMVLLAGRLQVKYAGSAAVTLDVGDYAYGPAGLAHEALCVSETPCSLFIAFELPIDALAHDGAVE